MCNPTDYASQKFPNWSWCWQRIQSALWLKKITKKKDFKEIKLKKKQGWRISKKRNKLESPSDKKGMKRDLKYIQIKLNMNLQLGSDNETNILKQSPRGRTQPENSVEYKYQIHDYMCTFKWWWHKSFCFGFTVKLASMKLWLKACYRLKGLNFFCLVKRGWTVL